MNKEQLQAIIDSDSFGLLDIHTTTKIYSRESNIDDYSLHFECESHDWRKYLGDNGIFLGIDLPHSRIDYYVYDKENLIFDTRHGYHTNHI